MLVLIFVFMLVWMAGSDLVIGQTRILTERPVALNRQQSLGQTFSVPADSLYRLDLLFATRRKLREQTVRLSLYGEHGQTFVAQEIDARLLRDGWYSFTFPALAGVAGQTLRAELERDAPARSSVALWVGPGSSYPGQGIFKNELDPSFDLAFRAYVAIPPTLPARLERVGELADAISRLRPGPFGQPALFWALSALYATGLAALVCVLTAHLRRP